MELKDPPKIKQQIALSATNVVKSVELNGLPLEILKGITLEIKCGESLAILGRSGSGKTSLLGLLAGLDLPTSGSISIFGESINAMSEDQRAQFRAENLGFVFQSFHLLPSLTALENVMLPLELHKIENAKSRAESHLAQLGLSDRMSHYPAQLSGGEQQRVALARAFCCEPKLLFADEPTGNLDQETGQHIIDLMFEYNQKSGTTLVLVTHDELLAKRCSRSVLIDSGCLR